MELWRIMAIYQRRWSGPAPPSALLKLLFKKRVKRQAEIHYWDDPAPAHDVRFSAGHFSWQRPQVLHISGYRMWHRENCLVMTSYISLGRLTYIDIIFREEWGMARLHPQLFVHRDRGSHSDTWSRRGWSYPMHWVDINTLYKSEYDWTWFDYLLGLLDT